MGEKQHKTSRAKYTHVCKTGKPVNLWGKPGLEILCMRCDKPFILNENKTQARRASP